MEWQYHCQVLIHLKSEWFQKLLVGKSALIYLLACVNIDPYMFLLKGVSSFSTWSPSRYVLNNPLLLLLVGGVRTVIYRILVVGQILSLFSLCLLKNVIFSVGCNCWKG